MSDFLNNIPVSPIKSLGNPSIRNNATFGTNFSILQTGGYMEVYNLSDLDYIIPNGYQGLVEYSGNTIPIQLQIGNGQVFSPNVLTLNSDNISSGRRKLGMLVYVYETKKIYQYSIDNYDTLWDNAIGASGPGGPTVVISTFGTTIKNNSPEGQSFINVWTASTVSGINGYNNTNASWRVLETGGGGSGVSITGGTFNHETETLSLYNSTGGTISITGFTDVNVTGGTYNNGTATFTNNTGGTFSVSGFSTSNGVSFTGGTVSGATIFTNGLSANTFSATTYGNLPIDIRVTGATYSSGTATFTNNTGGTFNLLGLTTPFTGGTVSGTTIFTNGLSANTISATTYNGYIPANDSGVVHILSAETITGQKTFNPSVTASTAIARGQYLTPTLVASANSDVLVGLDIAPTFTNGAFTGVKNYWLQLIGNGVINGTNQMNLFRGGANVFSSSSNETNVSSVGISVPLKLSLNSNSLNVGQFMPTTGNLLLQSGGTFTDAGYRLDVAGLTRFQGTTSSDTAPLGAELASVTGTGANWTLVETNLNVGGYTHTVGATTPLTTTLAAVIGTYYQITYTITGRTAGSILISYGGYSISVFATGNTGPLATSTNVLTITPTTDFDGNVVLSVKSIGTSSALSKFDNSSGTTNIEVRASNITSNTFIGINAGRRNTTGVSNTLIGVNAGINNTTGGGNTFLGVNTGNANSTGNNNTFLGFQAGQSTTIGGTNTFIGLNSGINNTTGANNTLIGGSAGRFIADGVSAATILNTSVMIGNDTKPLDNSQSNQIVIGYQSVGLGSNTTVIGNSSTVTTSIYGNLLIGTTSDNGSKLRVSGSVTSASAIARGVHLTPTLVASANNDALVGLDIAPTFNNGAFTGVTNYAARINGNVLNTIGTANLYTSNVFGGAAFSFHNSLPTTINYFLRSDTNSVFINAIQSTGNINFRIGNTPFGQFFNTTGNLILQSGGTFTDAGYRLDVSGRTRLNDNTLINGDLTAYTVSATTYYNLPSSTFSGGTVSGSTIFTNGLSANTFSATTIISPSISSYGLIVATSIGYQNIF
jgi:hypothetical protein